MSNPTIPMESDASNQNPTTSKRGNETLVDPDDGSEISTSKKARIEPDQVKKVKCLKFILQSYQRVHDTRFNIVDSDYSNVTLGNQIINIVFTCFNIKRQSANGISGNAGRKAAARQSFTVTSLGQTYTIGYEDAMTIIGEVACGLGLKFEKFDPKDANNWYGTAAPYLDFFVGNSLRMTELRVGHNNMPIKKEGDKHTAFPVSKYGLNGSHHILLEGCTFPPEKRGSMAQSLGPMTTLLCHIKSEEKYRKKWTDAAKRAMAHVPVIDEILDVVRGKQASEVRGLISVLADVLMVTTGRQAQRMFFPVNMVFCAWRLPCGPSGKILDSGRRETSTVGGDNLLEGFNVSGNGGFYMYNVCTMLEFKLEGRWEESMARQVMFHCIFGTYKEDLSVLEQLTDIGNWNTREEIGNRFQKMTAGNSISVKLPVLRAYSKLCSANQTGLLASSYVQTCSAPVFSGYRRQHFAENFFAQIGKNTGAVSTAKSIPQLTAALVEILAKIRKKVIDDGSIMDMGTVEWRKVEGMTIKEGGALMTERINATGKFFLGRRQ